MRVRMKTLVSTQEEISSQIDEYLVINQTDSVRQFD